MDSYDDIVGRMKEKFASLAGYTPDDASDIGIRIRVLAEEIYSIGAAVDWLKQQTFAQTATGTQLELRAQERGVFRKQPVAATGALTFSITAALWFDLAVPEGTVCSTSGTSPVRYVTAAAASIPAGQLSVTVPAQAELPGSAGNTQAGAVTVMVTPPAAMHAVTNVSAFTGGEDSETDDSLRARLLQSSSAAANGANAAWYREAAVSYDGVDSAGVIPRVNGAGTVAVYLGGRGAVPSAAVVQQVSDGLNAAREICTQVTVSAASAVAVDVTATVRAKAGVSSTEAKSACQAAVQDYFCSLGVGDGAVPAALNAGLFATGLIDDCSLSLSAQTMAQNQLAVPGTVTVDVTEAG